MPSPALRLADDRIELVHPSADLVPEVQAALRESYSLHQRYLPFATPEPEREKVADTMNTAMEQFRKGEGEYRYFIRRLDTGALVGCAGLHIRDARLPHYELGYWVRESEQGKGYIAAAVRLLAQHAGRELGARFVDLLTVTSNAPSRRVAERCGFELLEIRPDERELGDGTRDRTCVYRKNLTGL